MKYVGSWSYDPETLKVSLSANSAEAHGLIDEQVPLSEWLGHIDEAAGVSVAEAIAHAHETKSGMCIPYSTRGTRRSFVLVLEPCNLSPIINGSMIETVSKRTYNLDGFDIGAACALAIVATALDGIITISDRGIIQTVNHATESIFGYTEDELIDCNVKVLMPEPYHGNHDQYLANYRASGIKRIIGIGREVVGKRKDGTLFPLDLAITEARVDGRVLFVGTVRDISERKAIETEIRALNEDLEARVNHRTAELSASNAELDAFAYSVSHDLRAPLRHIDGFIDLLRPNIEPKLDDKSRHYLDTITDSARRMGILIDNLLAFSRMSRVELAKHDVDLDSVVEDVVQQLQPELNERSIEWRISHLEPASGDLALLTMVWTNLIQNAFKFTRDRLPAIIEIGCTTESTDSNTYFIKDNGVGFDPKYATNLFGVFQRLHRQEEFEGTGIGLATVRRIVQRHGGSIRAESELGKGATFYLSLPKGGVLNA